MNTVSPTLSPDRRLMAEELMRRRLDSGAQQPGQDASQSGGVPMGGLASMMGGEGQPMGLLQMLLNKKDGKSLDLGPFSGGLVGSILGSFKL